MNFSELEGQDFFAKYLAYTSGTEVPTFFNRWACIVGIGAWCKQDVWIPFGNGRMFPNLYALLIGDPGTRKSTAIKAMRNLLRDAGYNYFASEKTSKEMFLETLAEAGLEAQQPSEQVDKFLWGTLGDVDRPVSPMMIAADEFNDFFGNNILEFVSMLGVLWDHVGEYKSKVKHGKSPIIHNPNVSILGGNTIESLCKAFPPEVLGQGFFSRVLFVYGEPNGRKIAFPKIAPQEETNYIIEELKRMRDIMLGEMKMSEEAKALLTKIYNKFKGLEDPRFAYYTGRRFNHLLKLVMIHTAADYSETIQPIHVARANTVLTHTEHYMPKALGEFGRAKNSALVHKVMQVIEAAYMPLTFADLWAKVQGDAENVKDLTSIIVSLQTAGKIQILDGGFLPVKAVKEEPDSDEFDWTYITDEERMM